MNVEIPHFREESSYVLQAKCLATEESNLSRSCETKVMAK